MTYFRSSLNIRENNLKIKHCTVFDHIKEKVVYAIFYFRQFIHFHLTCMSPTFFLQSQKHRACDTKRSLATYAHHLIHEMNNYGRMKSCVGCKKIKCVFSYISVSKIKCFFLTVCRFFVIVLINFN